MNAISVVYVFVCLLQLLVWPHTHYSGWVRVHRTMYAYCICFYTWLMFSWLSHFAENIMDLTLQHAISTPRTSVATFYPSSTDNFSLFFFHCRKFGSESLHAFGILSVLSLSSSFLCDKIDKFDQFKV